MDGTSPAPIGAPPGGVEPLLRVLVLTNTRQAARAAELSAPEGPEGRREYRLARQAGIDVVLRDRNTAPWNPWANKAVFWAGLDPLRALRILCFDRRADAVLAVFENTAFFLLLLRRLFLYRRPIVVLEVSPRGWRPRDVVLDFVLPRADLVLTVTEAQARYADATWRLRRPAQSVGCLIDEAFYAPLPAEPVEDYVLAVGDDFSRDYQTLVDACARLGCRLVLKTGARLTVPDGMADRVTVLRERLPYAALRLLYARARVVAVPMVPTDNPGGISTMLEAMAMGKPIVAAATDTSRELIRDGETGLIVPPRDTAALAEGIGRLLADEALAARLGMAARDEVERVHAMPRREGRLAAALRAFCAGWRW